MRSITRAGVLAASALILALLPQAASAECQHSHAVDRCLVGTWKMTENGAERWMRENIHEAHVTGVAATNNTITFKTDGLFYTGVSRVNVHMAGTHDLVEGTGTMNGQASGNWAADGGRLMLCPAQLTSHGSTQFHKIEGGTTVTVPMPHLTPRESAVAYHCAGDRMTTTQPMPRHTTATSTYTRLR